MKIPRNIPCPCKSGKKFKRCHGAILEAAKRADRQKELKESREFWANMFEKYKTDTDHE